MHSIDATDAPPLAPDEKALSDVMIFAHMLGSAPDAPMPMLASTVGQNGLIRCSIGMITGAHCPTERAALESLRAEMARVAQEKLENSQKLLRDAQYTLDTWELIVTALDVAAFELGA